MFVFNLIYDCEGSGFAILDLNQNHQNPINWFDLCGKKSYIQIIFDLIKIISNQIMIFWIDLVIFKSIDFKSANPEGILVYELIWRKLVFEFFCSFNQFPTLISRSSLSQIWQLCWVQNCRNQRKSLVFGCEFHSSPHNKYQFEINQVNLVTLDTICFWHMFWQVKIRGE